MKFIDWFAGIGGVRRGLELAGHQCVGFCENDKFATASYTSMHLITDKQKQYLETLPIRKRQKEILKEKYRNGEWYENDIREVKSKNIPSAECWCFGAPCQDFSIAGKRAGLEGERSSLIREIFRLLEEIEEKDRPEWIIYENVKGILSSNKGLDFLSILSEMDRLGYDAEWQNLHSEWYVPQHRERIYTIGHLRRYGRRKIFPIERTVGENSIHQIGNYLKTKTRNNPNQGRIYDNCGISPTLNKMDGGGRVPSVIDPMFVDLTKGISNRSGENSGVLVKVNPIEISGHNTSESENLLNCINANNQIVSLRIKEATKKGCANAYEGDCINLSAPGSNTRRGRVGKKISNTLDTSCNQGILRNMKKDHKLYSIYNDECKCYIAIRRLTPKECFRLQGWTDDYFHRAEFVNSDSQLYKQAGNGVTVPVVYEIGKRMNN